MLKRLYVDNYKCLVNFEYRPQQVELLVGDNGSGKSAVFEVLEGLRQFVTQGAGRSAFGRTSWTRWLLWQSGSVQSVAVQVEAGGAEWDYELRVRAHPGEPHGELHSERLACDGRTLLEADGGVCRVYTKGGAPVEMGAPALYSALGLLPRESWAPLLEWFGRMLVIHPNVFAMGSEALASADTLVADCSNFASWYGGRLAVGPTADAVYQQALRETLPGLAGLHLFPRREGEELCVVFRSQDGHVSPVYAFDEMSDGQKMLAVLLGLRHLLPIERGQLICVDEPTNWISLRESQPWIREMQDAVEEHDGQLLVTSHSGEVIDWLAPNLAVILRRVDGGATELLRFEDVAVEMLTATEVLREGLADVE